AVAFPESGIQYANLLTSSAKATTVTEAGPGDAGTQIVAMTALDQDYEDSSNDVRIALLGSPYLVADSSLLSQSYNLQFTEKLVDWLSNRETAVSVAYKYAQNEALAIPDQGSMILLAAIVIGGLPLLVMGLGIFVWFRRRRL
ncbi:MAG: hypothetical protein GX558_11945, partial [Clostridiales bacterium]|nr:hypothetical protein [Clostridiales bacterium]